jgi:glycosyltransferase involved in cell wall biosynthesis
MGAPDCGVRRREDATMSIQLSIIIPVYKVEDYVQECLESVFSKIPEGVEIIVVDDGSPDRSMEIIKREFDEWITRGVLILLEQENKGPGGARNFGLSKARGKYIGFLDSDDVLLEGYFDELVDRIDLGVADIIEFGFKRFHDVALIGTEPYSKLYPFSGMVKLSRVRDQVFANTRWFPSMRVYRQDVLRTFRFPENTHYEDLIGMPKLFSGDLFVQYLDVPLLGYRERQGSITSVHTNAQMIAMFGFYQSIPLNAESHLKILKLGLARTLMYFHCELNSADFPIHEIIEDIKAMQLGRATQKTLSWPDWIFYKAPSVYALLNNLRLKNRWINVPHG